MKWDLELGFLYKEMFLRVLSCLEYFWKRPPILLFATLKIYPDFKNTSSPECLDLNYIYIMVEYHSLLA